MSLTEEEYVKKQGLVCPNCNSANGVSAWDRAEVDDGVAWQDISCNLCNAEWIDNYNLVGYSRLEVPEKEDTTNIQHPPNQQVAENWARIETERIANRDEI